METIQLASGPTPYAEELASRLLRDTDWEVLHVNDPDFTREGVIIIDEATLERLTLPVLNPERIVLITSKDSRHVSRAWEAGIVSVVFDSDPVSTAMLAIVAARLRRPVRLSPASGSGDALV